MWEYVSSGSVHGVHGIREMGGLVPGKKEGWKGQGGRRRGRGAFESGKMGRVADCTAFMRWDGIGGMGMMGNWEIWFSLGKELAVV